MEKGTIAPGKPVSLPSPPDMLAQTTSCGGPNTCDLLQMLLSAKPQGRFAFPVPPTLLPAVLLLDTVHVYAPVPLHGPFSVPRVLFTSQVFKPFP